jgi:FkbH-like protein
MDIEAVNMPIRSGDDSSADGEQPMLVLTGTYTVEPLLDALEFWIEFLDLDLRPWFAPYAQMFQQLLDPGSVLRRNRLGINAVLFRWSDLTGSSSNKPGWDDLMARVTEVADALRSFDHRVPCVVVVGPSVEHCEIFGRATDALRSLLAGSSNVHVQAGELSMELYRVNPVVDPVSEHSAHVPYTPQALMVLATVIIRWYVALLRSPIKMIATDGDNTLWAGVVGEDGYAGVRVEPGHAALQNVLLEQNEAGRLLCLLSKNEESDIRDLFACNETVCLEWSHWAATRVDWSPKPANLRDICTQLGLGLDSVLFLDDNPVECAAMRAECPQVMTVNVPADTATMRDFAGHLWLFDRAVVTAEDKSRTRMYREQAARLAVRESTQSLKEFLDGLNLEVDIRVADADDLTRLAQLSQRTNQFNTSLVRCQVQDMRDITDSGWGFHYAVRVRDRFGDYGIVGQLLGEVRGTDWEVDLFTLSCRALGRGIEHRMLAAAGQFALAKGASHVVIQYQRGDRNGPARQFLETIFKDRARSDQHRFSIRAELAANLVFDPSAGCEQPPETEPDRQQALVDRVDQPDLAQRFECISRTLTSGVKIEQAVASRVRQRPDLHTGFVAPAAVMEREIAAIWEKVLRIGPIGVHDSFQDLGGKSIHLVRVHSLIHQSLKIPIELTTLFQHPTVASLASQLSSDPCSNSTNAARQRGARMREARAAAANRIRVSK